MKTVIVIVIASLVFLAFSGPSFGRDCYTDLDCNMYANERCVVPASDKRGVCVTSGSSTKDREPVSPPPTPSKRGQSCMTNGDCDPGQSCVKKANSLVGACY